MKNHSYLCLLPLFFSPALLSQEPAQKETPAKEEKSETSDSKEALEKLQKEIADIAPKTAEDRKKNFATFIKAVKDKMNAFVKQYPNSPESYEIRFQLADISSQVDNDNKAAAQIVEGVMKEVEKDASKKDVYAQAIYTLGQIKAADLKFDDAKKLYNQLQKDFADSPFASRAAQELKTLDTASKLAPGNAPIAFDVKDLNGKQISPASFKGKVLLIDFWATWCPPCRAQLPNVKETYTTFKDQGFEILAVSLDKDEEKLKSFIANEKMAWPQFFDGKGWQNEIAQLYAIHSIPATFLVDRSGKIRYKNLEGEELKAKVKELLAEKAK